MHLKIYFNSFEEIRLPVHCNRIIQVVIYNNISPELAGATGVGCWSGRKKLPGICLRGVKEIMTRR